MTDRIRQSLELSEILSSTATEVRAFLGTDRVKVYRFAPRQQRRSRRRGHSCRAYALPFRPPISSRRYSSGSPRAVPHRPPAQHRQRGQAGHWGQPLNRLQKLSSPLTRR